MPRPVLDLCIEDDAGDPVIPVTDLNEVIIPEDIVADDRLGSIERLATTSDSWGGVVEGQEKARPVWTSQPVPRRRLV